MKAPFLLGRLFLGGFFLYNGINHLVNRDQLAQFTAAKGLPNAKAGVIATGAMLTIGGTSIVLGVKPKLGTAAIMAFLAGISPVMHDFWRRQDPSQRANEMAHFAKNIALLGAALALMGVDEPWSASVPVAQPSPLQRLTKVARRTVAA